MLDVRATTIIYQAQVYYTNLINSLVSTRSLGKEREDDWRKADLILGYLQTWNYEVNLPSDQDTTNYNYILYALIQLCGITSFPVGSPLALQSPTYLLQGQAGQSITGPIGPRGLTGLATDFNAGPSTTSILVDSFLITDAKAARWDYLVSGIASASRAGSVIGHWTPTGSETESADTADNDLISTTDGIEFDVQYSGGTIFLIAVITSGTWTISGSRYFIPNNGSGTGPISGLLPHGQVYIGNILNLAQAQPVSGDLTISDTGVATLSSGVVFDANINASANIATSKLAPLTINSLVATNGAGKLTTIAIPTPTNLAFFDISSSLTTLLNAKLTDPTTSIGDLIFRNGSNNIARLPIGATNQVLTVVGGIPIWQTPVAGFADPMTSVGDLMIRNGGNITSRLGIGSANQVLTVIGGLPVWSAPAITGVTSISASQPAAGFTISGSPITTSGTLTFALSDDLAGVEGLVTTGIVRRTAPNVWLAGNTVTIAEGGTNITSYVTGDLLYSPSTNTLGRIGIGSTNQVLTVIGGIPTWSAPSLLAAGSNTQVQFNNGGVLGATDKFLWTGNQLNINDGVIANLSISNAAGGFALIQGPTGNGGNPNGGNVTIAGGSAFSGGAIGSVDISGNIIGINNSNGKTTQINASGGGTVTVGGNATVNINTSGGGSVTTIGNTSAVLNLSGSKIKLSLAQELQLNASAGTAGQFLQSQGVGLPPIWGTLKPVNTSTESSSPDLSALGALATSGTFSLPPTTSPDLYFVPAIDITVGFSGNTNGSNITFFLERSINAGSSWTSIKSVKYSLANSSTIIYATFGCTDSIDNVNTRIYRIRWSTSGGSFNVTSTIDYAFRYIILK